MRAIGILVLLALLPLVPNAAASCPVPSDSQAFSVGGALYVVVEPDDYGYYYDVSIWRETNGHNGLQRSATICPDGTTVARDRPV